MVHLILLLFLRLNSLHDAYFSAEFHMQKHPQNIPHMITNSHRGKTVGYNVEVKTAGRKVKQVTPCVKPQPLKALFNLKNKGKLSRGFLHAFL